MLSWRDGTRGGISARRSERFFFSASGRSCLESSPINASSGPVPRTSWRYTVPIVKRMIAGAELVRESMPFGDRQVLAVGYRYWQRVVEVGLAGATAEFALPDRLGAMRAA